VKGIRELLRLDPSINLVVLDDAFQHRYVKPKVSVVLMEWNRPIYNDDLLPLGRLREPQRGLLRADIVVITKCPSEIRPMDVRIFHENLDLFPHQHLYFSHYRYGALSSVFPDEARYIPNLSWLDSSDTVLLISGIANPNPLLRYLRNKGLNVKMKRYPDHHDFSRHDLEDIANIYNKLEGVSKYIITTEKDAVRLANNPYFPHSLKAFTFYLPICVEMLGTSMPANAIPFDQELRRMIRQKTS
jgi:tetraacyldisaccharide 4'-kinase